MLNYIWLGLIVCAVAIGGATGNFKEVTRLAFENVEGAVMKIALPLVGIMALWLGVMRLAEKSGMVQILARALRPVMVWLFPDVPGDHPAMGSMLMNMAANMLGLSNAATPLGIRAMEDLETLNPRPGTATNAMCTFLAINTSSIQLIPVTAIGILAAQKGAENPTAIVGTSLMATTIAFIAAIIAVKTLEKLPMFALPPVRPGEAQAKAEAKKPNEIAGKPVVLKPLEWWGVLALIVFFLSFAALLVAWLGFQFKGFPFDPDRDGPWVRFMSCLSAISIPLVLSFFPLYAFLRGIKVYEEFVEGAKEGFNVIIRIIPNLVAILVAIGMFRGSGAMDKLADWLRPAMNLVQFPPELLPMALIRPLSGSGSLGVFTDIVLKYGPNHILSRTAGTIFGSTETTFYVIAVYFGAVGIKRARHAVPAGLVADVVAIFASVYICKMVFA